MSDEGGPTLVTDVGGVPANNLGRHNGDDNSERAEPPPSDPDQDGADPEGEGFAGADNEPQAGAGGAEELPTEAPGAAVDDADGVGLQFPAPVAVVPEAGPTDVPTDLGRALVVEDMVDPDVLTGAVDGMSSSTRTGG